MDLIGLVILFSVPMIFWWGKVICCVKCKKWFKRRTTSDKKVARNTTRTLLHGRVTKGGRYDRRYNTKIRVTEYGTRYRKFICADCDHTWKLDEPYEDSKDVSA